MVESAVTLDRFKEHLNKTNEADDAELFAVMKAATRIAEDGSEFNIGPIVNREITVRAEASAGVMVLPTAAVVEVVSVSPVSGAGVVDVAGLDVDSDTGIVRSGRSNLQNGRHVVTYVTGRAATVYEVPDDIQLAVCFIGKYLWDSQRGRQAPRSSSAAESNNQTSGAFEMNRARVLLQHYRIA